MYTKFPKGTIRGPYTCGKGTNPRGGIQHLVYNGDSWHYFIEPNTHAGQQSALKQAQECADKLLN